jgi:aminopeptidase N
LRAIAPDITTALTPPERLSLAEDEWALVRAGHHTVADYLTLAAGFGQEHTSGVLADVTTRLAFIADYLTTAATRPQMEAFIRSLIRPLFDELGFATVASESDDRRALRAAVVGALGTIGEDPAVIAQARAAVDDSLTGGPALEPTVARAVIRTAASHGDAKLFDALSAAAGRATSPEDQYRYLNALADFRDPELVDRGLRRTLSASVRSQDASSYLAGFFSNPAARARAWSFVKEQWPALEPKVTIAFGDTRLVAALGRFCDAPSRDDIRSFFGAHKLPGAVRTLDQTFEQIDDCLAMREKQTAAVAGWLAAR